MRGDLGGTWLWVVDAGESGPDADSLSSPAQTGRVVLGGPVSYFWQGESFLCCPCVCLPHPASHPSPSPRSQSFLPLPLSQYSSSCPLETYPSSPTALQKLPLLNILSQPQVPHSLPPPPSAIPSLSPSPGQILSATQEQIAESYYPGYLINPVRGQLQTRQASSIYDDSYLGE